MDMIMRQLVITAFLLCLGLFAAPAQAAGPSEVIQEAVDLLTMGWMGARKNSQQIRLRCTALLTASCCLDSIVSLLRGPYSPNTGGLRPRSNSNVSLRLSTSLCCTATQMAFLSSTRIEFEIMPYKGGAKKRTTTVKTKVRLDDGSKIPVNYVLVNRNDQWRMFDVTH